MKFAGHKYIWTKPFSYIRHHWELRGPRGGVHFHASIMDGRAHDASCGLEFHHSFDPTNGQQAPHHINCPVTGGQCWHEGTSLYASERVWPMVSDYLKDGDHEMIFRLLEGEYNGHFGDIARPELLEAENTGTG